MMLLGQSGAAALLGVMLGALIAAALTPDRPARHVGPALSVFQAD